MSSEPRHFFAFLLLILAVVAAVSLSVPEGSAASALQESTPLPTTGLTPTATRLPADAHDLDMTNGIIAGGVILVLIVIGGTLSSVRRYLRH